MDYAKTLKLRFRVGDLDLPERRIIQVPLRSLGEDAQMCPCGKAVESTLIVGEGEIRTEERHLSRNEEIRRMWHGEVRYTR